jgi:hypothetical protein
MRVADMPLPPHRHIPGQNDRPDEAFLASLKAEHDKAWRYGIRLLNAGYYWETHEVLEPVWLAAAPNSRERHLVQAVIHLANGMLKEVMGRPNARRRLAGLARASLAETFPGGSGQLMGLDAHELMTAADRLFAGESEIRLTTEYEL